MKYSIVAICLLIALILIPGCAGQTPAYTDAAKTIDVKTGGQFTIALEGNATTGYAWEAGFDQNYLKLVQQEYKENKSEPGMVGVPGKQYFTFEALESGQTEISLNYKRSWEAESIEHRVFKVNIK